MNGGSRSGANPRLAHGLVRFAASGSYVLEGGPLPTAFTGPGVQDVLPELCDLLDGTRSEAELATLLDISMDDIDAAVDTLWKQGLLEYVDKDRERPDATSSHTFDFLSRNAGFTGRVFSAEESAERLELGTVLVAGSGALADTLGHILSDSGVHTETLRDGRLPARWAERQPDSTDGWLPPIILVCLLDGTPATPHRLLMESHEAGLAWIAAGSGTGHGFVGPLTHRDYGCPSCTLDQLPDLTPPLSPVPVLIETISGTIAGDVVHALTGVGHVRALHQVLEVRWGAPGRCSEGLDISTRRLYRRPACPACGDARLPEGELLPWKFEQDIADPPPQFWSPAALRRPPDTRALEESERALPTCPSLPASDDRLGPSILELTELLGATVGARPAPRAITVRRIVPTAGNLASAQAFVLSRHLITGLDSNAAWFDSGGERLVASGRVTPSEAEALFTGLGLADGYDRIVVWVGMVGKLAAKYQDLALRLVHLDAGVVLTHAALMAEARGLRPLLVPRWETELVASVLDLDSESEMVTGIMAFNEVRA
ncbi:hypothetical protein [Streptomyces sp. NPDC058092]|uniref:hypothetical protein n=1 Tax=Streptomyces sp. NPDC058092 TaxID=3346336 RepID=UPI0036E58E90